MNVNKNLLSRSPLRILCLGLLLSISACDNNNDNSPPVVVSPPVAVTPPAPAMASIEVTITNLTNAQPISPVAAVLHANGYSSFAVGESAGLGLEMVAESGDNTEFLSEANAATETIISTSGAGVIPPGASETITFEVLESDVADLELSALGMLVNTNDAFSGVNAVGIGDLETGSSATYYGNAYDSGTESDDEAVGTIPGPADSGEGFNAERSDIANIVTMHTGVVSRDDGLISSALTEAHRFDNPVVKITVTRSQ